MEIFCHIFVAKSNYFGYTCVVKRILFYLLLVGAIVGGSAVVLWVPGFWWTGSLNGQDMLEIWIKSMVDGTFKMGASAGDFLRYGMILFILMNAAILLTMLLVFLFSGFNLNKIAKFYRICFWYFISSLVMSGVYAANIVVSKIPFSSVPWMAYIPVGLGVIIIVIGIIFRTTEKNK